MIVNLNSIEYHAHPALSHSRMKVFERSPLHFKHSMEYSRPQSDALDFGKLFHAAILEPETIADAFVVAPEVDRRTKVGKEEYAAFIADAGSRTVVSADMMRMATAMTSSISDHPAARDIVFQAVAGGRLEESHVWTDKVTGLQRKSRIDAVLADGTVVDLKTTIDASPRSFARSVLQYGYHTQAAYYADAMTANRDDMKRFVIVAIEKTAPFAVGVYELDREAVASGRAQVENWMSQYIDCVTSGVWSSYSQSVELLGLPSWTKGTQHEPSLVEW